MVILLFFAFLSGLVTIAAPCIWPLLPLILSTTTSGGHRKPLGLTIGICLSFGMLTLFLSTILTIIPFDPNVLRYIAVGVIVLLGMCLLIPAIATQLEGWMSRWIGKIGISFQKADGFWSGLGTGLILGIVWTPCAGPILATIATLAATQKVSFAVILVTVVYITGIGIPLFFFALGGKALVTKSHFLSSYLGRIQQLFGIFLLLAAVGIATNYDKVLEAKLLDSIPSYQQFLNMLENNTAVRGQLQSLKQQSTQQITNDQLFNTHYPAPDFAGVTKWLNTDTPLSLKELQGKVVLVDFWTYSCINCIRTLPHVTSWYDKYKDKRFVVIGVHTPEFAFEKETGNVANAIKQFDIHYPVAQDNNFGTWNAYTNEYWPAEYLIDAKGIVRRTHFGEGEYDVMEKAIQTLLTEAGQNVNTGLDTKPDTTPHTAISPETYLGASRMQYFFPVGSIASQTNTFQLSPQLPLNTFSYGGKWDIENEYAETKENTVLNYHFTASNVYLVAGPTGSTPSEITILLDGKPIDAKIAGADVHNGMVSITSQRLYDLVNFHGATEEHILELHFTNGSTQVFTFTFG